MENNVTTVSYRDSLQQQFTNGRRTLLGIVIMTVLNMGLLLRNGNSYFLFSASVPYYLTALGKAMDDGVNSTYTWTGLVISAVILVVYLIIWLVSKKRGGWMTGAVVLFCLDLAALAAMALMLFDGIGDVIVDLLIHIVAIYQMAKGTASWKKLQSLPPEVTYTVVTENL